MPSSEVRSPRRMPNSERPTPISSPIVHRPPSTSRSAELGLVGVGLEAGRPRRDDTNARLDALRDDTNGRFAETNMRLDRIERRQTEAEVRLSTELVVVVGAVREVPDLLRDRVEDHEQRLVAIEKRVV
jgi:hypothetical protein